MKNPLLSPILSLLKQHPNGVSEYDILKALKNEVPSFSDLSEEPNLNLFRQHFFIMNALYQLQDRLWREESLQIDMLPSCIRLVKSNVQTVSDSNNIADTGTAKLASYYLDWDEYDKTHLEDVEALLNQFYKGIRNPRDEKKALDLLKLPQNASEQDIKQQYRKLARQAHPDKGGSAEAFIELRQAFELLTQ